MPPVLGPVSPSPMRLWSCAEAMGAACVPSQRAKKESSSPVRNSSRTISVSWVPSSDSAEHLRGCLFGLEAGLADDDAFARGEAVGLDDDGEGEAVELFADLVERGADGVGGGGDVVALHELFGEGFARFELRGGLRGAEDAEVAPGQLVDDAKRERNFGADDGEAGALGFDDCRPSLRGC